MTTATTPVPVDFPATRVILTFDDGPIGVEHQESGYTSLSTDWLADLVSILSILEERSQQDGVRIQGVFYACFGRFPPGDLPDPYAVEQSAILEAFSQGLAAIHARGHRLALHAFNHRTYELLPHGGARPGQDIKALMDLLPELSVPVAHTWRPPFGGVLTWDDEAQIASGLDLTHRTWAIDSDDWTYHQDGWGSLVGEPLWWECVQDALNGGVFWHGGKGKAWVDVLLHVNHRTATHLSQVLDLIEACYDRHYGNGFGRGKQFHWLAQGDPIITDYLGTQA